MEVPQNKVKVCSCGHSVEDVCLVWYEQLSLLGDDLRQSEVTPVHVLKVMFLQCPLDHLSSFVLAGQQDAFVHIPVVLTHVNAHPDYTGVCHLPVIHRQRGHGHGAFVVGGESGL